MSVRAKFYVSKLEHTGGTSTSIGLRPVMPKYNQETRSYEESENKQFWDATPSGQIELQVNNPAAAEFFKALLGQELYIDFIPAQNGQTS